MANEGELGYLLSQRQRPAAQGGAALGYLLGGGGQAQRAQIYNQAAYRGAQMQDVLAQARQRQQSAIARENYANELRAKGESELASMVLASGANMNPSEIAKAREDMVRTRMQQAIYDYSRDPNFNQDTQTRMLEALEGKVQKHAVVEGDTYFDPTRTAEGQSPQTTALGKARISELGSLVAEHGAQARRAEAGIGADKAANYEVKEDGNGGYVLVDKMHPGNAQPVTSGGAPVKAPKKETAPRKFTDSEFVGALGGNTDPTTGKVTVDPVQFGAFMRKQNTMPGASDFDVWNAMTKDKQAENTAAANTPSPEMLGNMVSAAGAGAGAPPAAAPAAPMPQTGAPRVGEVRKGYRYKGGDPSDQANWEKAT